MPNKDEQSEELTQRVVFQVTVDSYRKNEIHDLSVEDADWYLSTRSAYEVDVDTNEVIIPAKPEPVTKRTRPKAVGKIDLAKEVARREKVSDKPTLEVKDEPKPTAPSKSPAAAPKRAAKESAKATAEEKVQSVINFDDMAKRS